MSSPIIACSTPLLAMGGRHEVDGQSNVMLRVRDQVHPIAEPALVHLPRLRRLAVVIIKSKGASSVAQKVGQHHRSPRLVFDYLRPACA